jgi:hypothetical protein
MLKIQKKKKKEFLEHHLKIFAFKNKLIFFDIPTKYKKIKLLMINLITIILA